MLAPAGPVPVSAQQAQAGPARRARTSTVAAPRRLDQRPPRHPDTPPGRHRLERPASSAVAASIGNHTTLLANVGAENG